MRIRKRPQIPSPNPLLLRNPPRDLSSHPPPPPPPPPPFTVPEASTTSSTTTTTPGSPVAEAQTPEVKGGGRVIESAGGGKGGVLHRDPLPIGPHGCTANQLPHYPHHAISTASGGGDPPPTWFRPADRAGQMKGSGSSRLLSGSSSNGVGRQVPRAEDEELDSDSHKRWEIGVDTNNPSPGAEQISQPPPPPARRRILMPRPNAATAAAAAAISTSWCTQDTSLAFPLKKRRGGQDRKASARRNPATSSSTTTTTTTTTTNSSTSSTVTGSGNGVVVVKEEMNGAVDVNAKKRRTPAVLMEGSRCSRVNGRGWRCCQQTLVGYSLCEHHLGKGRLRSMSSVRCNPKHKKKINGGGAQNNRQAVFPFPSPAHKQQDLDYSMVEDEEYDQEEKPLKKMRKKIGTVKARSISSLLDQTNHSTSAMAPPLLPATEPALPSSGAMV